MYIPEEVLNPCEERQGLCKQVRRLQGRSSFSVHTSIPTSCNRTYTTGTFLFSLRFRLHVPSTSPIFVPFKNGFKTVLWCCLHTTSKGLKVTKSGDVDDTRKRVFNLGNGKFTEMFHEGSSYSQLYWGVILIFVHT